MRRPCLFTGGPIVTLDPSRPRAGAILVADGRIVKRYEPGEPVVTDGTEVVDLGGRTLLPGMTDAHTHLVHWGFTFLRPQLQVARSRAEAIEIVREADRTLPPGRVLIAEGWDESLWGDARFPTRADIDRLGSDRPIVLRRICGHMAVASGAALACLPSGPDVDPETGLLLEEAAMGLARVFPPTDEELDEALAAAQASYLAMGVTAVHDMTLPAHLRALRRLEAAGSLHLSIAAMLTRPHLDILSEAGLGGGWSRGKLTIHGVKFFADGSIGARTAALHADYSDAPGERGQRLLDRPALTGIVRRAVAGGVRLAIHAIGDQAVDDVVAAFDEGGAGRAPIGHRIEHLEMVGPPTLESMRRLGLVASMQPNFVWNWGRADGMYEARLGRTRAATMNPFHRVLEAGVPLLFGSDGMPADPILGLRAAVEAPHPDQRIGPVEAMVAMTRTPWDVAGQADRGRLAPGAPADLVEWSEDPTDREGLKRARVVATWVAGKRVFASVEEKRPTASGGSG